MLVGTTYGAFEWGLFEFIVIFDLVLYFSSFVSHCLKLSSIHTRVSKFETSITDSNKRLLELEESRNVDSEMGDELKSTVMAMETQLTAERCSTTKLKSEISALRKESLRLTEEALDLQSRSIRDYLMFLNVDECNTLDERRNEDCIEKI